MLFSGGFNPVDIENVSYWGNSIDWIVVAWKPTYYIHKID